MTGLVSLEIELGVEVEKALVRGLIREEQEREHQERAEEEDQELGWTSLSALNVMNVQTALYFLGYRDDVDVDGGEEEGERRRQQPRQCRRQRQCRRRSPITVLRLDSREPVDAEMLWLLTMHLRRAGGNQDEDGEREEEETTVKSLQLALRCGSAAEFGTMLDRLAKDVPHVETLGLHLACPTTNTTATTTSATTTPALSSSFSSFSSFHPFSSPSPSPTSPSPSSSSFVWSEVTAAAAAAAAAAGAGVGDRRRLASTPSMDVFPTLAKGIAPFARLHTFSLALVAPSPFHFSSGTMTSPPPSPTTTLPHPHPASANYGTRGTTTTVSSSAGAGTGGVMGLDVEALTIGCGPQLRLVELQWDAWRMNTTTHTQTQTQTPMMMPIMTTSANQGVSSSASPSTIPSSTCRRKWEPITVNKNRHPFLRREWAYKVAEPASYWW
ncbi:hypothetical protein FRC17_003566 [Serendipita sp. 399]|nr:hypothetical protein FRC17_003566 [Serendipita sp. 399]